MTQAMTQMMEAQGREDHYESFQRHDPPTFSGGRDPMVVEEWFDQLEEIFRVTKSGDHDKVELAPYRLRGEASQWWKRHRTHGDNMRLYDFGGVYDCF
jgi:hypothetical protein